MATLPVAIDARGAVTGAAAFNRATKSMGYTAANAAAAIRNMVGAMAAIQGVRSAVRTIAEFELTMRKVQGVTGQTTAQMAAMVKQARQLGATTQFTASQAGEGLLFLSRAGFSATESMTALPSTLNLAAAAGVELGFAADLASNVLRQFGLEASETTRVVDALVRVSNQANTDVQQLGEAMKFAGPIAGALGKEVEETAVLIGLLGDAGIQASMAGTNLRGVMLALSSPTEAARKAIASLGLSVGELAPDANSMQSIFQKFQRAGLNAAQASDIFGRRNAAAALILSGSADAIDRQTEALASMNSASKIAAQNMDTLDGAIKSLQSAFQEMMLAVGDNGLAGGFRALVEFSTSLLRSLTGIETGTSATAVAANALAFALKTLAVRWAALTLGRTLLWLKSVAIGLAQSTTAMLGFNSAVKANPLGLLLTAGAALLVWFDDFLGRADKFEASLARMSKSAESFREAMAPRTTQFEEFDKRIADAEKAIAAVNKARADIAELQKQGAVSLPASELRQNLPGISLPSTRGGAGGNTEIVTLKQAEVSLDVYRMGQEALIETIIRQRTEHERTTKALAEAAEAKKKAAASDAERIETAQKSIDALRNETSELEFQSKTQDRSLESLALLNAQRRIHNERSKAAGTLIGEEGKAFEEWADKMTAAAVGFAKLQQKANIAEFEKSLATLEAQLGKTADEIEVMAVAQDAQNVATRNGIKDVDKYVETQKARIVAIQQQRNALAAAAEAERQWSETAARGLDMVLDRIVDFAIEGGKARDVIEDLARSLGKLYLRQSLSSLIGQIGAGAAAGAAGGGGGAGASGGLLAGGNIQAFASGGLINGPVLVPHGMNLLGEAGPEFVLPAKRGADGKLGVAITGGGSKGVDNRSVTITQNFYDQARDHDSFRRNTRQTRRDASDFLG